MKNNLLLLFAFFLISAVLIGCQSKTDNDLKQQELSKVSVAEFSGFGKVDQEFFEVYQDEENLRLFADLLKNASKEDGIVDIVEPEYDLEILYESKRRVIKGNQIGI